MRQTKNLNGSQFLACWSWDFIVSSTLEKKKISRLPFYSQNLKYKMAKTHTVSWGGD